MLTPERWQRVRDVLEQALELAPEKRSRFLDVACSSDPSLRSEVQSLLSASDQAASSFLQSPPVLPSALTPGTRLGDYEIVSQIGSGGMGVVYRAKDLRLGRDVAIKVLPAHLSSDASRLRRFEQEAQSAAALNHPNILAVHQLGTYESAPYLVSELLEGETLREHLKHGALSQPRALEFAEQITDGLNAAHERGIIHRDLKPENLFVTKDNRIKILDFGLAKLAERDGDSGETVATLGLQTRPGQVAGTVGYMSPEQVRGEKLDTRTDLFSFGVVLYEMVTGKRPFDGDTSGVTFDAILNRQPTPPTKVNPKVAPGLENIITKALEKDREVRYQHASDIRADLKRLRRDSETGRTVVHVESTKKLLVKSIWLRTLGMGVLVAGIVLTLLWFHKRKSVLVAQQKATHRQFTFFGNAYDSAISPDGKFVAFVRREAGEDNVLVVQAENGTTQELARLEIIGAPRWSPDGSEVLYYFLDAANGQGGIRIVSRLGGAPRLTLPGTFACWSTADGSEIAYASGMESRGFHGFHLANIQNSETKDVPISEYQSLGTIDCSPHLGLILLVTHKNEKNQIVVFKNDGSGRQIVLEDKDDILSARWSPSGDAIYYFQGRGSTQELKKVSLSGSERVISTLAGGLETSGDLTVSLAGLRLAYTRTQGHSNLWRLKFKANEESGKTETSQITWGTSYHSSPAFSPDGRWIVFVSGSNDEETNVYKISISGSNPIQLTQFQGVKVDSPVWSPDGQRVAFLCEQGGIQRVWVVDANGGPPRMWEDIPGSETGYRLAWGPSHDLFYQEPEMRNYIRIDESTRRKELVIHGDPLRGWVPWRLFFSPDATRFAVCWHRSVSKREFGTWIISVHPYSETLLMPHSNPVGWSPDGRFVYAMLGKGDGPLGRYIGKIQVKAPHVSTLVATLPGGVMEYDSASVSPDGREIVVSIEDMKSDVWIMENFDPAAESTK